MDMATQLQPRGMASSDKQELRSKDVAIETLEWRLQASEGELLVLRQRVAELEEGKRAMEMDMALVREEASRSLKGMVEAQRDRKKEEVGHRQRVGQLELQVGCQVEELHHLRLQLAEEAKAHRDDVQVTERRAQSQLRQLRLQLRQAQGERGMARWASQPDVSSQLPPLPGYNTLSPRSPAVHAHLPLLKTVSEGPPPTYQQTTGHTGFTLPRSPLQRAPVTFHTGVSAFHGHLCYFSSFMTNQIHAYNTSVGAWHLLPTCPVSNFGLEVVNELVTTIGGRLATAAAGADSTSLCTNKVFSLLQDEGDGGEGERGEGGTWVETVAAMTLPRAQPATASNSRLVIVAGGEVGDHKSFITDIEVLLLETNTWCRVSGSPLGNYSWLTAVLCGEQLYLVEGLGSRERDRAHSLHMGALVESIVEQPTPRSRKTSAGNLPWKRVKHAPASNTTCVCARGRLIAVGGIDTDGKTTNEIWALNESSGSWGKVGSLKSRRYRSLVGVTATGSLLVIGGLTKTRLTDHIEVFDTF